MHDHAGDVGDAVHVAQQLLFHVEETTVDEVVVLDARKRQRELRVLVAVHEVRVHMQEAGGPFPNAPRLGGGQAGSLVIAGEAAVEGRDQVVALHVRDRLEVVLPCIREQAVGAFLVEPFQLPATQHEDAAQHQFGHALRMGFRVRQRQGRPPAAAEHLPALHLQVLAQFLDVGHQVPGGVVHQVGMRGGTPGTALVEQDDPVLGRVVELAHFFTAAATGATVQHHHRLAVGVAALFEIQRVAIVDLQRADVVRGDGGIQRTHDRTPLLGTGADERVHHSRGLVRSSTSTSNP